MRSSRTRACDPCTAEGDSPIFADTKIGTVPWPPGSAPMSFWRANAAIRSPIASSADEGLGPVTRSRRLSSIVGLMTSSRRGSSQGVSRGISTHTISLPVPTPLVAAEIGMPCGRIAAVCRTASRCPPAVATSSNVASPSPVLEAAAPRGGRRGRVLKLHDRRPLAVTSIVFFCSVAASPRIVSSGSLPASRDRARRCRS